MAIPEIEVQDVLDALKYIDENNVPSHNQSVWYELVTDDGKKYPPKYVVAVANHLAHGADISTDTFGPTEANRYLENLGFDIQDRRGAKASGSAAFLVKKTDSYLDVCSSALLASKNLILRGAPGTGKSYLAKQIATDIVSNGYLDDYTSLSDEQKSRIEFVQFHPSYDYTDFVEGLRPVINKDGSMGFELKDGVFKQFVTRARSNFEKSCDLNEEPENYVFIIDEINRGEMSRILGEMFFAIDPGYRGKAGEVSTQYANLHSNPEEKFFIPENVYIIGTMNDIDRSVDSFDFAIRRRFRFIEIKADDRLEMLSMIGDKKLEAEAVRRMKALNAAIAETEDLNENYQIGASYFLKLKEIDFDQLWTDHLEPLLQDYVQGMYDEKGILEKFAEAYGYKNSFESSAYELPQD